MYIKYLDLRSSIEETLKALDQHVKWYKLGTMYHVIQSLKIILYLFFFYLDICRAIKIPECMKETRFIIKKDLKLFLFDMQFSAPSFELSAIFSM